MMENKKQNIEQLRNLINQTARLKGVIIVFNCNDWIDAIRHLKLLLPLVYTGW